MSDSANLKWYIGRLDKDRYELFVSSAVPTRKMVPYYVSVIGPFASEQTARTYAKKDILIRGTRGLKNPPKQSARHNPSSPRRWVVLDWQQVGWAPKGLPRYSVVKWDSLTKQELQGVMEKGTDREALERLADELNRFHHTNPQRVPKTNPGGKGSGRPVKIVFNRLLGGWYIVRGPHDTPLSGRFDTKEEAYAWLEHRDVARRAKKNPPLVVIGNPSKKGWSREEHSAYQKGLADGRYGLTYINPYWSDKEMIAWSQGFSEAKKKTKKNPPLMVIGNPPKGYFEKISFLLTQPQHVSGWEMDRLEKILHKKSLTKEQQKFVDDIWEWNKEHFNVNPPLMVIGNPGKKYPPSWTRKSFSRVWNQVIQEVVRKGKITPEFASLLKDIGDEAYLEGQMKKNPPGDLMSDSVHEVRYTHRKDGHPYKHTFKAGVRMVANEDGTITMYHPTKRIHEEFPD